ncbi:MAG TPA: hypothetical protein DDX72_02070 [Ruminococcaceae bacterium]|nr:hypothetical protein [Oscillospiraceae bacterium]
MKGTVTKLLAVMLSCALLLTHASAEDISDTDIAPELSSEAGVTAGSDIETDTDPEISASPETDSGEILKAIEKKTDAAIAASDGITPFTVELTEEESEYLESIEQDISVSAFRSSSVNLAGSMSIYANDYFMDQMDSAERSLYINLFTLCQNYAQSGTSHTGQLIPAKAQFDPSIGYERMRLVYQMFYFSNPQFFFLRNGYSYNITSGTISPYIYEDFNSANERARYSSLINSVTSEWLTEINNAGTDLDKQKMIYKKLCDYVTYDTNADYNQSIASVFALRESVCNGYALAAEYLCNAAGIDCIVAVGQNHAWNIISLDGKWYEFDVTWMDVEETGRYNLKWRNKSYSTFLANDSNSYHSYRSELYGLFRLPECRTDMKLDDEYYSVYSGGSVYKYTGSRSDLIIPDTLGISAIYYNAFKSNTSVTSVTMPEGVSNIYSGAFSGCANLTWASIPITMCSIGAQAFYNSGLTDIYYEGTEADWNAISKGSLAIPENCVIHYNYTDDRGIKSVTFIYPSKTEYYVGESLDISDGRIYVVYNNGGNELLDLSCAAVAGFNSSASGKQTVRVFYEGFSGSYTVNVKIPRDVQSITVLKPASVPKLYTGDELDLTGYTVKAKYNDGTTETTELTPDMVTGYDPEKAGIQRLNVTCGGKTATFTVTVVKLAATKIAVEDEPKTAYYLNDDIDLSAGTLRVTYNSGKSETVPMTDSAVAVKGFDSTKTGVRKVTLTFLGKTVTINIEVSVDPDNAPVLVNGTGYENIASALRINKTGELDIVINTDITEKTLTIPKTVASAKITTAGDAVLTLTTPTITANCDLTLDCAAAAEKATAKTFTVKTAADKTVTIKRLDTALPLTLGGTKTSDFILDTGSGIAVTSAALINVETADGTTVILNGGRFTPTSLSGSGKLDVYGASTVTIANVVNADITLNRYLKTVGRNTTVNLQKLTIGEVGGMSFKILDPDGSLSDISGQTVITLSRTNAVEDLENRITIANTAGSKTLSAVQYKKDIRAEYLDALTVSDGTNLRNFSSFEKAFEAMTDTAADYTVTLNESTSLTKLTLPRLIGSLTIDGNGNTLNLTGVTSISPRYGLTLKNISIASRTKTGAAAALTITDTAGNTAIDGLEFTGSALSIKGGTANSLTLGKCSPITSLTGFANVEISDETAIAKTFTANNVYLGASADLKLLSGATFTLNRNKVLTAENGAKITLVKGFKPIVLNGSVSGAQIALVSDTTLEDQQIFRTKEDLSGKFDISGISPVPAGDYSYDLLTASGIVYLKAFTIDMNGTRYAFWNDAISAMNSKTSEYTITLLADVNIGAALRLPTAAKCGGLTIDGNGHKVTFTGTSVSLTVPTTLKDITMQSVNSRTGAEVKWTLKTNKKLIKEGSVELMSCTEK